jgi:hypothetical protein
VIRRLLPAVLIAASCVALVAPGAAAAATTDKQLARAGVLVLSDFPAGWTTSARAKTPDAELDAAATKIATCKPFIAFGKANKMNPRAKSPNFDQSQSNVTNTVSVYPSDTKAESAIRTFSDQRMPDCLQKLFNTVYEQQLRKDPKTKAQVTSATTSIGAVPDVRIGDEAVAYQGTVDVGLKDGTTQTIGIGFAATRVGKAVAGFSWTSDTDISATLQPAIVTSVKRLQDAQPTG